MADFKIEFPDFPAADMPSIPEGFEDASWHNDMMPSFHSDALGVTLWIDYLDPALREFPESNKRFGLQTAQEYENGDGGLNTNDWAEITAAIDTLRAGK